MDLGQEVEGDVNRALKVDNGLWSPLITSNVSKEGGAQNPTKSWYKCRYY